MDELELRSTPNRRRAGLMLFVVGACLGGLGYEALSSGETSYVAWVGGSLPALTLHAMGLIALYLLWRPHVTVTRLDRAAGSLEVDGRPVAISSIAAILRAKDLLARDRTVLARLHADEQPRSFRPARTVVGFGELDDDQLAALEAFVGRKAEDVSTAEVTAASLGLTAAALPVQVLFGLAFLAMSVAMLIEDARDVATAASFEEVVDALFAESTFLAMSLWLLWNAAQRSRK